MGQIKHGRRSDRPRESHSDMTQIKKEKIEKQKSLNLFTYFLQPELILRVVSLIHIFYAPLTKVEESFNMQAAHDILYHYTDLEKYDHLEFPGVVPRTFIGPLLLSAIATPFVSITNMYYFTKFAAQLIVRISLSELVIFSFMKFRQSVKRVFGEDVALWLILITASQFHFMFYMGRTLPNVMALPAVLLAFHFYLERRYGMFIFTVAFDSIVFRAEVGLFFGILFLYELYSGRISFLKSLIYAIQSGIFSLLLTVLIDSWFWRRWVWPEGEVFWFNTFLNQSHNWGTSPFLWYFYSALPRSLLSSLFLLPLGFFFVPKTRPLFLSSLFFILIFSFLPHKELRFILPTLPIFNLTSGAGAAFLWRKRGQSFILALLSVSLIFIIVLNGVLATGFLAVSRYNYPGGEALMKLHEMEKGEKIIYNKTEGLSPNSKEKLSFHYLLIGTNDVNERYAYYKTHHAVLTINAFDRLDFDIWRYPPLRIKYAPSVVLLQRKGRILTV